MHNRPGRRLGRSTGRCNTRLGSPVGHHVRRNSFVDRRRVVGRHNKLCGKISKYTLEETVVAEDARFVVVSIAMLTLLMLAWLAASIIVVLAVLLVLVVGVLDVRLLALSLAVAIIILASLRMSGHLGG